MPTSVLAQRMCDGTQAKLPGAPPPLEVPPFLYGAPMLHAEASNCKQCMAWGTKPSHCGVICCGSLQSRPWAVEWPDVAEAGYETQLPRHAMGMAARCVSANRTSSDMKHLCMRLKVNFARHLC